MKGTASRWRWETGASKETVKITSEQAGRKREGEQSAKGRAVVLEPVVLHGIPTLRETVLFMMPNSLDYIPACVVERVGSRIRSKRRTVFRNTLQRGQIPGDGQKVRLYSGTGAWDPMIQDSAKVLACVPGYRPGGGVKCTL